MSSLTRSYFFDSLLFSSSKNVLTHHFPWIFFIPKVCLHSPQLLFVVVFFFLNRSPPSPDLFSPIVFCFSLQRISSLTNPKEFFSSQKCILTHHNLLFVAVFFFLSIDVLTHQIILVACTQLYNPLCPSVCWSVGW